MKKLIRILMYTFAITVTLISVTIFFIRNTSREASITLPANAISILEKEARLTDSFNDVPIAAGLWLNDTLLTLAHNTVSELSNAGGHAEINAISKALSQVGYKSFMNYNRDRLLLISTYEPCAMCRGAIGEYQIRHVIFIKNKDLMYRLKKEDWPELRYFLTRKQFSHPLQDSLFSRAMNARK